MPKLKAKPANRFLAFFKKSEPSPESERARIEANFLLVREKKKNGSLVSKVEREFLQKEEKDYQRAIRKILLPKVSPEDYEGISCLEGAPFIHAVINLMGKKKNPFTQEERLRLWQLIHRLKRLVLFKQEMRNSLKSDDYYAVVAKKANIQQLLCHVYLLIEKLTSEVDKQINKTLEKSSSSSTEALTTEIFISTASCLVKEMRAWIKATQDYFQPNQETAERIHPPILHVDLEIKDFYAMVQKSQALQRSLEKNEITKRIASYTHHKEEAL